MQKRGEKGGDDRSRRGIPDPQDTKGVGVGARGGNSGAVQAMAEQGVENITQKSEEIKEARRQLRREIGEAGKKMWKDWVEEGWKVWDITGVCKNPFGRREGCGAVKDDERAYDTDHEKFQESRLPVQVQNRRPRYSPEGRAGTAQD